MQFLLPFKFSSQPKSQRREFAHKWCLIPILRTQVVLDPPINISSVNRVFQELARAIFACLWLNNTGFTCRRIPLRGFHWVPHPSAPLSSRVFKGQEDPRCIKPGICRVVWGRWLLLGEWPGEEIEKINLATTRWFPAHSIWREISWRQQDVTRYQDLKCTSRSPSRGRERAWGQA